VGFGFVIFASGVDMFFLLSGFLIGGILLDHRTAPKYFASFYGRRFCRIVPVYYGFLVLTALAGVIQHAHGWPTPVFDAGTPYWMYFLFLQNYALGWFGDWKWITVTMAWSLALEEQCYLTLPAAVKFLSNRSLVGVSALFVLAAPILRYYIPSVTHSVGTLVLTLFRADGLAAGFLCAMLVRSGFKISSRTLGRIAIPLAALAVVAHLPNTPLEFLRGTLLAGFYSCVLLLATRGSLVFLESSFLRFFGTISYALYLFHQSALEFLWTIVRHTGHASVRGEAIFVPFAAFLLSIMGCWLSWVWLEKPLISQARSRFRY
jgi:peptidoglycan/LPS O-acetylase OafA/YrhL